MRNPFPNVPRKSYITVICGYKKRRLNSRRFSGIACFAVVISFWPFVPVVSSSLRTVAGTCSTCAVFWHFLSSGGAVCPRLRCNGTHRFARS